ncbi:F-box protein, partial [Cucurbita argyrosperma subsp. sororia]
MANLSSGFDEMGSFSFTDFPEDVQLCILSFLSPSDVVTFSCTSKRVVSLCRNDRKLWFTMCDRRWGSKTQIKNWGKGNITYRLLYRTLLQWENLLGFWRRSGSSSVSSPPLVFFEWGSDFLAGFRVSPSSNGTYDVVKSPFLWLGLSSEGKAMGFIDPKGCSDFAGKFSDMGESDFSDCDLVPVDLSFMGKNHFVIEENQSFVYPNSPEQRKKGFRRSSSFANLAAATDVNEVASGSPGSLPDQLMSEIYQHFANRTSPGGDRASRRQRRRERERLGKKKWEPEHFVKIVNCSPTPLRPLQGLWKGISDDMSMDFYLVVYDDIGGISCRRVRDSSERFSSNAPVFWTSNTTFLETPFSLEEELLYDCRIHVRPLPANDIEELVPSIENKKISRILCVNSSYDLVLPDLAGSIPNPRNVEGRIWQYNNGTFGFGFLRDNFIIDLQHIARNGLILDTVE